MVMKLFSQISFCVAATAGVLGSAAAVPPSPSTTTSSTASLATTAASGTAMPVELMKGTEFCRASADAYCAAGTEGSYCKYWLTEPVCEWSNMPCDPNLHCGGYGADEGRATYPFQLPMLPYGYDSLEPVIDYETMMQHYDTAFRSMMMGLNKGIEELVMAMPEWDFLKYLELDTILEMAHQLPAEYRDNIVRMGGAFRNHAMYFYGMTEPRGAGNMPSSGSKLGMAIKKAFGSFEGFKKQFDAAVGRVFGSGFTFLVVEASSMELRVVDMANEDTPQGLTRGELYPVLANDLWEHAYFNKYYFNKMGYAMDWWMVVDWSVAESLYDNYVMGRPATPHTEQ